MICYLLRTAFCLELRRWFYTSTVSILYSRWEIDRPLSILTATTLFDPLPVRHKNKMFLESFRIMTSFFSWNPTIFYTISIQASDCDAYLSYAKTILAICCFNRVTSRWISGRRALGSQLLSHGGDWYQLKKATERQSRPLRPVTVEPWQPIGHSHV